MRPSKLPINIEDLLRQRTVEGERIEYKSGWNPDSVIPTLCSFANDFENLGGGYVVVGQDCDARGQPVFPPVGLREEQLDAIQQDLLTRCNLIRPPYFPMLSVEEAIVNAVYHRSYELREPVEIRITPEELAVLSFPGPDRSIRMEELRQGRAVGRRYRNRRIGELLKELQLAEGRSTGIAKMIRVMAANGSPEPLFETDEERSYFLARLPVHETAVSVATGQVTGQVAGQVSEPVEQLLSALMGEMSRAQLQTALGLKARAHFLEAYLAPALEQGLVERTIPDKPRSRLQRYRLTALGRAILAGGTRS